MNEHEKRTIKRAISLLISGANTYRFSRSHEDGLNILKNLIGDKDLCAHNWIKGERVRDWEYELNYGGIQYSPYSKYKCSKCGTEKMRI